MTDTRPRTPLFIDCDTGIDDALALAYLLAEPGVDIVGIGSVSGNVRADVAADNSLALLELAGRDGIPVAVGAVDPRVGVFAGGAPHIHGDNGVGDVELVPRTLQRDPRTAVDLLADLAEEWSGSLRILALGPLTNLARFLDDHPERAALIEEVVVMGGAFDRPGNVNAAAEANIFHDPEAAARVFEAAWPLTILPLDITMRHLLSAGEVDEMAALPGAVPPVVSAMFGRYLDAYESILGVRHCALHDPLAALVAARAVAVTSETRPDAIGVVTDGPERGRTIASAPKADIAGRSIAIVRDIDARAADVLLDRLRAHPWPS